MQTPAEPERSDPPRYYRWEPAGKPVSIDISFDVIDRLMADALHALTLLPRRGAEAGGILLGAARKGDRLIVKIDDYTAVPCEYSFGPSYTLSEKDRQAFREAIKRKRAVALHPVGYYRTDTRAGLSLAQEDLDLLSEHFADPASVALLIKPRTIQASVAGFFFWEDGKIRAESSYLEFLVPAGRAGNRDMTQAEPQDQTAPKEAPAAAADIPLPSFLNVPPPKQKKKPKKERPPRKPLWSSWWVQAPLLACVLCAVGVLGYSTARQLQIQFPQSPPPPRDPYALSLMVLQYGDNLHLTWDRDAPALDSAERGVLSITDGGVNKSLELTQAQLRGGSVIYRRMTKAVRFRLEIFLKGNRSLSETWELRSGKEGVPQPAASEPSPS